MVAYAREFRMKLYVVFDTKGAGRLVGVFKNSKAAQRVLKMDPYYYQLHQCQLDEVTQEAKRWLKPINGVSENGNWKND